MENAKILKCAEYLNKIRSIKDEYNKSNPISKCICNLELLFYRSLFKKFIKTELKTIKESIYFLLNNNHTNKGFTYKNFKYIGNPYSSMARYEKFPPYVYIFFIKKINYTKYTYSVYIYQNNIIGTVSNVNFSMISEDGSKNKNYFLSLDELEKYPESKYFLEILNDAIFEFFK